MQQQVHQVPQAPQHQVSPVLHHKQAHHKDQHLLHLLHQRQLHNNHSYQVQFQYFLTGQLHLLHQFSLLAISQVETIKDKIRVTCKSTI
jgi:hypothetical protein